MLLLSILLSTSLSAQIFVDYANYKYKESNLSEIYFLYQTSKDSYPNKSGAFILVQYKSAETILHQVLYELSATTNDMSIDQVALLSGDSNILFEAYLLNDKKEIIEKLKSQLITTDNEINYLSDITVAYQINKSENTTSSFYKNGLEIVPNPSLYFDGEVDQLYVYFESYKTDKIGTKTLFYEVSLVNTQGSKISASLKEHLANQIYADYRLIDLKEVQSGSYIINLSVYGEKNELIEEKQKKVFITSKKKETNTQIVKSELAELLGSFIEEDLDEVFEKIIYIAEDKELKLYDKLKSTRDKQKFIETLFMKKVNNDPESAYNLYINYMTRIAQTNTRFGTRFRSGWQTDRGRVFILYGEPTDIERNMSSQESKPYEIWTYDNLEGRVIFIFGDKAENGTYELLHSDKRGEIYYPNWKNLLEYNTR